LPDNETGDGSLQIRLRVYIRVLHGFAAQYFDRDRDFLQGFFAAPSSDRDFSKLVLRIYRRRRVCGASGVDRVSYAARE
jgi:hypothetical protein